MDEVFLSCFYIVVSTIEKYYDVESEDYGKCANIAYQVTEKAMAKYSYQDEYGNFPNGFDCIYEVMDEELPKYFTQKD